MSNSESLSRRAHWLHVVAAISMAALPLSFARADALDWTLDAFVKAGVITPEVAQAKPLIKCIADGGELYACGEQAAKQQAGGMLPIQLSDPRIKQIVDVVAAVQNGEWLRVLERGGKEVARIVACAALPPGGPLKQPACDLIGKVIDKNGQQFGEIYGAISSGDWWGLIKAVTPLFGPEAACAVIPDGPVKDVACGALGKVLQEAYEFARKIIDLGAQALNYFLNLVGLGESPHMPTEQYEQLYWKTWYHRGTDLCMAGSDCPGLKQLKDDIFSDCKSYFSHHQMSDDSAQHTCNGMEQRFIKAVKAYAESMKAAADAFAENKRPFARTWAVEDYGKNTTSERKTFIVENCMFPMRANFPFPEPIPARCEALKGTVALSADPEMYEACLKEEQSKLPSPSAWSRACQRAGQRFQSIFSAEKSALQDQLPKLVAAGCMTPKGWTGAEGLMFTCGTYESFQACRRVLSPGLEEKRCTLDQAKADQRWAQTIAGVLGAKRCKAVGINVSCTRPWKRDACNSMLKEWSTGLNVKPAVQCRFDNVTAYQALVANATIIVKTLNGAPGSSPANCKSTWDPATITCSDPKVLSQLPDLLPSVKLEQCPPDPNKDGADAPCYGGPIPNVVAVGPVVAQQPTAVASGIDLTADPNPQLIRRGGMNPTQWGGSVSVDAGQALSVLDGKCYFGLHFELRNLGTVASPPFEFTLGAQGAEPSMRRSGPLAAGATSSQDMFAYLPSGTSVLRLTVDSAKQVLESNEQNNALEVTVNVSGSCGGRSITR